MLNQEFTNTLYKIFPNLDINLFNHYFKLNKFNLDLTLYSYGLFSWEFNRYKKEIDILKKLYERGFNG